jgi:hypothetical protein
MTRAGGGLVLEEDVPRGEDPAPQQRQPMVSRAVLSTDVPAPSTTGVTMIRTSSTSRIRSRLTVRSVLPRMAMSLPGRCLSSASSSGPRDPAEHERVHLVTLRSRELVELVVDDPEVELPFGPS